MTRKEEIVNYANSFKAKGMEIEELKEMIRLAIIDGATWADKTMIDRTYKWLSANLHRYDEHIGLSAEEFVEKFSKEVWQQPPVNLWKPADGDDFPELEREVVVFTGIMKVGIAHRPNPNGWDGKSITTGKVKHYTPKIYDKGGWNIPDVKYWLDCELPKMEE